METVRTYIAHRCGDGPADAACDHRHESQVAADFKTLRQRKAVALQRLFDLLADQLVVVVTEKWQRFAIVQVGCIEIRIARRHDHERIARNRIFNKPFDLCPDAGGNRQMKLFLFHGPGQIVA